MILMTVVMIVIVMMIAIKTERFRTMIIIRMIGRVEIMMMMTRKREAKQGSSRKKENKSEWRHCKNKIEWDRRGKRKKEKNEQ